MRPALTRAIAALPTLFRIGVAETVAYRAEFVVWMLTSTMPLINLALWTSVANEAPFAQYKSKNSARYFLSSLLVRNLTANLSAFKIGGEVRMGVLSRRLLRPIHPFIAYATSHSAALPFRSAIALPLALILLLSSGASALTTEPLQLALLLPSILLSWLITFGVMFTLGSSAFWLTQPYALVNVYFGVWTLLSGYMMPIKLLPGALGSVAEWLPFYSMLGAPVELMTRSLTHGQIAELLARQAGWAVATVMLGLAVWRQGVRHFEAVGG